MAKFKTRARTLDMLGRQQIAGIPTAISELFKNAHDAYADTVEVDFYRSDGLFVLRDDGLGMTKKDFEERWLTLGTESKMGKGIGIIPPPIDPDKEPRPILGEKGIGRLAIASIGPQVLILTRAKRNNKLDDIVGAFINWRLFELPGVDLDEIIIPLKEFKDGNLPDKSIVRQMVSEVINNIYELNRKGKITFDDLDRINIELNKFEINPADIDNYLEKPSLKDKSGTHFFIMPADEMLSLDIDKKSGREESPLTKLLLGFTNTTLPYYSESKIRVSFRDHKTDEYFDDLIGENEFFTSEEFKIADHHFKGEFDEYGQFNGTVKIYGEKSFEHIIPWLEAHGKKTLCGPFKINVAYVQGAPSHSKIPPDEHARILNKLDRIGGLYIYRNGIRILPYGNYDYDFIEIEKRRTLSASYYYFSYRRMIGFIDVTTKQNPSLIEKAGREGFRENKAYRQFRDILSDFFVQLAADFFREEEKGGGPKSDFWLQYKNELEKQHKARREADKRARKKKLNFKKELDRFFKQRANGVPQNSVNKILEKLNRDLLSTVIIEDPILSEQAFLDAESNARLSLNDLRAKTKVTRVKGFAIGKQLQFEWRAYLKAMEDLEKSVFEPAYLEIEEISNKVARENKIIIDRRRKLERAIDDTVNIANRTTKDETRETNNVLNSLRKDIKNLTRSILTDTSDKMNRIISNFQKLNISQLDDSVIVNERIKTVDQINIEVERNKEILENIRLQLENISWIKDDSGEIITSTDILEAIDEERVALLEKEDINLELYQLGLAVGVIHHEFSGTVNSLRKNLKRLKAWADLNEDMNTLYKNLRTSFDHLDGYLTLFTPLSKRLYKKEVPIIGNEIRKFIEDLFFERFERHNIKLKCSSKFLKKRIHGYPSTFYPVFVNIIDNAIFWLQDVKKPKEINLDSDNENFIISNNGPEIPERDREIIFELGFTRKPQGRGMGLYISKEVLKKVGYNIYVSDKPKIGYISFIIEPLTNKTLIEED